MAYKTYVCKCGHEVLAESQPSPLRWNDGHTCRFHLSDEDSVDKRMEAFLKASETEPKDN